MKGSQLLPTICQFRSYDAGRVALPHNVATFMRNEIHTLSVTFNWSVSATAHGSVPS